MTDTTTPERPPAAQPATAGTPDEAAKPQKATAKKAAARKKPAPVRERVAVVADQAFSAQVGPLLVTAAPGDRFEGTTATLLLDGGAPVTPA